MSWQAVSYAVSVLDQESDMTMTDRLVLVLLAEHAHKDGSNARPSSGTIARRVGVLPSSVRRSLGRLVSAGVIAADRYPGRPTSYRFPLSTPVALLQQVGYPHPLHQGADLLQQRDTPVAAARHEPVMNRSMNQYDGHGDTVCIWCENTGWEYEDDNHVRQCRAGHRAS